VETFGGDLELKRLDLTWSGQVDLVDLTAATPRSTNIDSKFDTCISTVT